MLAQATYLEPCATAIIGRFFFHCFLPMDTRPAGVVDVLAPKGVAPDL